jgi:hypothetical protein
MTSQQFATTSTPVAVLVEQIDLGDLALPDLQRPFVWKRTAIRDLLDSLYRGYPAGYLLFWRNSIDIDSHQIGSDKGEKTHSKMIVDGQQRLTSLYAVIKGKKVINEDNEEQFIRIAFNPLTREFRVANASSDRNPEFVSNVSEIWSGVALYKFTGDFIANLKAEREVSQDEENRISENLGQLHAITNYAFSALELSSELEVETVAEIFQRINSRGVPLNSADFILTLMSVHWPEGRHELEDFARSAKKPSTDGASPYNQYHTPSPDELLRVVIGLALKRGVLQQAYQVLRGQDPKTRQQSKENRDARFDDLKRAQSQVLNLTSWHEYMVALKAAGFSDKSMLTSANNFLYGYLVFLIGKIEFGVERLKLRYTISRWFFMASLTGRYTGSPESILESDLRKIETAETPDQFVNILNGIIDTQLTSDFWSVTLPDRLESSAAWSPYLFGYYAALNLLDAKALFSKMKISELLSPDVNQSRSPVERHHLFPRAYLAKQGITGSTRLNQIGNFAFIEWADNVEIGDKSPAKYFPEFFGRLSQKEQAEAEFWHALPADWPDLDYNIFLQKRRLLIAKVVQEGFRRLSSDISVEEDVTLPAVEQLLRDMETYHVEFKATARLPLNSDIPEKVINEGVIKTVAAFMNSGGGTLGIGITDDGDILGVQPDLDFKKQDLDEYQNWLSSLLTNAIGGAPVSKYIGIRFEAVDDKLVCLVDVKKSSSPIYADTAKGKGLFYVRVVNTTRILAGPEIPDYTNDHF